jgi:mannose/fructose/N-acetylgalactosamine-specific phosphotransferase system component IID
MYRSMYSMMSYRNSVVRSYSRCMVHSMSSGSMGPMCCVGCVVTVCCMIPMGTMVGAMMTGTITGNNADEHSSY